MCDVSTVSAQAAPLAAPDSIDIQYLSPECSVFSQAGLQKGLDDTETLAIWDQIFLRLAVEQPRTFVCENVRGMVTMKGGAVLQWVLKGFFEE
jgi:site-specific DNA-cytosine methylase